MPSLAARASMRGLARHAPLPAAVVAELAPQFPLELLENPWVCPHPLSFEWVDAASALVASALADPEHTSARVSELLGVVCPTREVTSTLCAPGVDQVAFAKGLARRGVWPDAVRELVVAAVAHRASTQAFDPVVVDPLVSSHRVPQQVRTQLLPYCSAQCRTSAVFHTAEFVSAPSQAWSSDAVLPSSPLGYAALVVLSVRAPHVAAQVCAQVAHHPKPTLERAAQLVALSGHQLSANFEEVTADLVDTEVKLRRGPHGRARELPLQVVYAKALSRGSWGSPPPRLRASLEALVSYVPPALEGPSRRFAAMCEALVLDPPEESADLEAPLWWDPFGLDGDARVVEAAPEFLDATKLLGVEVTRWRAAFELADSSLSYEELFDVCASL